MKAKRIDYILLFPILVLFGIGLIMVYSASPVIGGKAVQVFQKQLIAGSLGLLLMTVATKIPYNVYRQKMIWYPMYILAVALLIAVLFQRPLNGATRWFVFPFFTLQPLYFAMFVVVTFVSAHVSRDMTSVEAWKKALVQIALHVGFILLLLGSQPDFGNLMILAGITGILLFLANIPMRLVIVGVLSVLIFATAFISLSGYRRSRVLSYLYEESYQTREAAKAIASGGLLGAGIGQGKRRLGYLPEANSDFIFSALAEDMGFFGTFVVLSMYLFIFGRGLIVLSAVPCKFARLLGSGILFLIVAQAIVNISVNLTLLPNKGLPLPFISAGGSALIFTLASYGVLLNISRYRQLENTIEA
ncbi:MAG: hypothetical protein CSA81_09450 [Acidobacteria bacterium]|nr:MAG: hypothetical protein CSA81_09450 [Acidobacteriota bacterium]